MKYKDPAFLFYSKDWIEGTSEMLPQEKGVYIDLLAHQHQKGSLPSETNRLCRLVGMNESEFIIIWNEIKDKFSVLEDIPNSIGGCIPNGIGVGIPRGIRLVNQKLNYLTKERGENAIKNKINGYFASIIRYEKLNKDVSDELKKRFKVIDFTEFSSDDYKEKVLDWVSNEIKNISRGGIPMGIPNGIPNGIQARVENANNIYSLDINTNTDISKDSTKDIRDSNSENWFETKKQLIIDEQLHMKVCGTYGINKENLEVRLIDFIDMLELKEDFKSYKETKNHFINWVSKSIKEEKNKPYRDSTGTERANDYQKRKKLHTLRQELNLIDS
jgi:hypothetical protein